MGNKGHILFSSTMGMRERSRRTCMTYLEVTYIPIFCLHEKICVYDSHILTSLPPFMPRQGTGSLEEWETRDKTGGICLQPPHPVTFRPDSFELTRNRVLADAYNGDLPKKMRILTMPILLGEMDVVLSMPANATPYFGTRRELGRLVPTLPLHLRNYQLK